MSDKPIRLEDIDKARKNALSIRKSFKEISKDNYNYDMLKALVTVYEHMSDPKNQSLSERMQRHRKKKNE